MEKHKKNNESRSRTGAPSVTSGEEKENEMSDKGTTEVVGENGESAGADKLDPAAIFRYKNIKKKGF